MVKEVKLTYADLAEVIDYNAAKGEFTWRVSVNSRSKVGQRAGVWQRMQNGKDYYSITYRGRKLSGAQVAWLLHYGAWPDRMVFFVDGNPKNLRIENLKMAEHKANKIVTEDGKVRYKMTTEQIRHYGLARNYNLTMTEYAQMFSKQSGVCAICNQPETARLPGRKTGQSDIRVRDLSVDHDHETGAVRELLCNACNHMLGASRDNSAILRAAADYLDKHKGRTCS